MTSIRLLADDLSGALDTAAEFVGMCGPFDFTWPEAISPNAPQSLAIDSGTRERAKADERGRGLVVGVRRECEAEQLCRPG